MSSPRWSDDGRWIAVQTEPAGDIHVVAADASSDRAVWRGDINAYAWSTAGPPLLAVLPRRGGLAVVEPGGRVRWVLARGVPVISVAWRGADLSWAMGSPRGRIGVLTADGVRHTITGAPAADLLFAHWVGTDHLLAWLGGPGRDETGGLDLADLRVEDDRVTAAPVLTTSLVAPAWVVPGPAGTAAADSVLVVGGGGAIPWRDKSVLRCGLADDACAPLLANGPSVVTLDPAWSPDADSVALVEAAAWQPGEPGNVNDWFPTRRLWVVGADGTNAHPVAGAGPGATAPSWSPAGSWLRYNTGDAVVAVPAAGGDAVTLAGGLSGGGAGAGPDGYGKGPWTALVAWSPTAA
jgi:hypothetical protein